MYDILFQGANINLDLVNFDEPVTIQELRIIPLGAQIEINPGGLRLGATNPMTFHLEAYAADVKSNKKLSTFQKIGRLVSPNMVEDWLNSNKYLLPLYVDEFCLFQTLLLYLRC